MFETPAQCEDMEKQRNNNVSIASHLLLISASDSRIERIIISCSAAMSAAGAAGHSQDLCYWQQNMWNIFFVFKLCNLTWAAQEVEALISWDLVKRLSLQVLSVWAILGRVDTLLAKFLSGTWSCKLCCPHRISDSWGRELNMFLFVRTVQSCQVCHIPDTFDSHSLNRHKLIEKNISAESCLSQTNNEAQSEWSVSEQCSFK